MIDVVVPIAVLGIMLAFVDQVRRLVSHAILNGTIRRALKSDPASVPLLVAKLESGSRLPGEMVAWVMVAGAAALAAAGMFEEADVRREAFKIAAVAAIIGIAILVYTRWVRRTAPDTLSDHGRG